MASLPFEGALRIAFVEFQTSLVAYPRIRATLSRYLPGIPAQKAYRGPPPDAELMMCIFEPPPTR
eukprot:14522996-Alexandrium_andersonii.AAC.1